MFSFGALNFIYFFQRTVCIIYCSQTEGNQGRRNGLTYTQSRGNHSGPTKKEEERKCIADIYSLRPKKPNIKGNVTPTYSDSLYQEGSHLFLGHIPSQVGFFFGKVEYEVTNGVCININVSTNLSFNNIIRAIVLSTMSN